MCVCAKLQVHNVLDIMIAGAAQLEAERAWGLVVDVYASVCGAESTKRRQSELCGSANTNSTEVNAAAIPRLSRLHSQFNASDAGSMPFIIMVLQS